MNLKLLLYIWVVMGWLILSWCSSRKTSSDVTIKKEYCVDVTSYDNNRDNDMKCYKSNGEVFFTNYETAEVFEEYSSDSEGYPDGYQSEDIEEEWHYEKR